jgi:UDP-galactopyranose mutase
VRDYGGEGVVGIATSADEFVAHVEATLTESAEARAAWLARADALLARTSWNRTWARMRAEILDTLVPQVPLSTPAHVRDRATRLLAADAGLGPDSVASLATGD